MNKRIITPLSLLGILSSLTMINAQSVEKDSINRIKEVQIKGHSLKSKNSTSKVDVITTDEIKNLVVEQPLRILEHLPGINVVAYGQGGVADQFSMRGFSSGGHGGEAGVEVDGVSLNEAEGHSDGYADLNILIPLNLKKISVYKGPTSAVYGRFAQAGVVSLETRKGGDYSDIKLTGGSYNTFDAQYAFGKTLKIGERENALKTNLAVQVFSTDGYIKHSDILKGNFSGRVAYQLSNKSEIAVSVLGHRSEWGAPGYISKEQYYGKTFRNQPAKEWQDDRGNKKFLSERVDFSHNITDNINLLVFGYGVQQDFVRFFTINGKQTERINTRNVYAFGGSINGNTKLFNRNFDWTTGVEFFSEKTYTKRWNTSFKKRTSLAHDRYFDVQSFSVYAQSELDIHRFFRPSLGVRFDVFGGNYTNKDTGKIPVDGNINGISHFSPKLGFRSTLMNHLDFRANVSNGFSLPNSDMKYGTNLKPVELWQYETGFSFNNEKNIYVDVAGFVLTTSREILERPIGSGEFVNAGETRRMGVEADARIKITEGLSFRGSYTYTKTKIINGDNIGKSLTQLPSNIFNFGAIYTSPIGLGGDVMFRAVSDYYTDDANTYQDGGYKVVNLKVFYNFDKFFSTKGSVFLAVNNLFNEYYAETIFGTSLFSASPTRNFSVGLNYSF